jgi:hypothetical protein
MKFRKLAIAFSACALAALTPLTFASPASAADGFDPSWNHTMYTDDGNSGGRVRFDTHGDIVELCDIQKDGYSVYLSVWNESSSRWAYHQSVGGNGECEIYRASSGYDLTEGDLYEFRIGLGSSYYWDDYARWWNDM